MAERVTIQDIADALGLSRYTVSKAINNTGSLADATRERILNKAVEMGYKQFSYMSLTSGNPFNGQTINGNTSNGNAANENTFNSNTANGNAFNGNTANGSAFNGNTANGSAFNGNMPNSSLAYARTTPEQKSEIALVTRSFLGNSHFASLTLDKFQQEITKLGYNLSMHMVLNEDAQNMVLPRTLSTEKTAGIICFEMFDHTYANMLCNLGIPILFADTPAMLLNPALPADILYMDNRTNILAFMQEMAKRGKTKFGFVGESTHCHSFYERYASFREAQALLEIPYSPEYSMTGSLSPKNGGETYAQYLLHSLEQMKELPEVFLCANDFVAIDLLQAFKKLEISVPEDVWLCGFDDAPESRIITPPLTTIHIHTQIMGVSAAELLISRINEPSLNFRTIHTETTLIYRESTGDRIEEL